MITHGFAEGVRRANLYLEAGADMAYTYPNNEQEARQAPKEIAGPCVYMNSEGNRLGRAYFSIQELEDMGYKMVSYAVSGIMVAAKAVKESLETLMATGYMGTDQQEMRGIRDYLEETIGLEELYKLELETVEGS
jgi:methylisocitrate lyase